MLIQAGFDVRRQFRLVERCARHLIEADRPVGAGNRKTAIGKFDIAVCRFEHMGGDARSLGNDFVGRIDHRRADKDGNTRVERSDPGCHLVGIAIPVSDFSGINTKLV